jgi:histidine ammonia-lyase
MHRISLEQIESITFEKAEIIVDKETLNKVSQSFRFLTEFSKDKIIYGINTGFGPMAQFRIDNGELNQLQYNLIRNHACGMGKPLEEIYARSVLLARLNAFLQGNSGVSLNVVEKLVSFLNNNIVPEIFEHGGVGASGDLVQLAHLGLNLIGEGKVFKNGKRISSSEALKEAGIEPLQLQLRDGLAIINGTSCMTGIAAINLIYANRLLNWSIASSSIINEIMSSFSDSFSEGLNNTKQHKGQKIVAKEMRNFLDGSKLIRNRKELFADASEFNRVEFKNRIQEYYSIRCVPQILGPIADTIENVKQVVLNEFNSTNDNPVVLPEHENVFHGGNFHGDYISLEMDKLKIVMTKLSMLMERQLNFLMNDRLNNKFPPFLNAGKLGLNFGFQGLQFTATSTTAENQSLSNSVYVHSIPNNKDNQDMVSMGTNSASMAKMVIDNCFQVMAIHVMAICQAVDLLKNEEKEKLSANTIKVYKMIREIAPFAKEDKKK